MFRVGIFAIGEWETNSPIWASPRTTHIHIRRVIWQSTQTVHSTQDNRRKKHWQRNKQTNKQVNDSKHRWVCTALFTVHTASVCVCECELEWKNARVYVLVRIFVVWAALCVRACGSQRLVYTRIDDVLNANCLSVSVSGVCQLHAS